MPQIPNREISSYFAQALDTIDYLQKLQQLVELCEEQLELIASENEAYSRLELLLEVYLSFSNANLDYLRGEVEKGLKASQELEGSSARS